MVNSLCLVLTMCHSLVFVIFHSHSYSLSLSGDGGCIGKYADGGGGVYIRRGDYGDGGCIG